MGAEVIVTGSHQNFHKHPNFPITPEQIAAACLEARSAGAAVVHIHVRDPETGAASGDPALYHQKVFEPGHIVLARRLIEEGLIEKPPMFQICLGIPFASPATPEVMALMRSLLPEDARWAGFGISRWEFPMVAQAVTLGGHVRVGLEDNMYLSRGEFASNGQLVEKAVRIVRELGADVVEPSRAAQMLELSPRTQSSPPA